MHSILSPSCTENLEIHPHTTSLDKISWFCRYKILRKLKVINIYFFKFLSVQCFEDLFCFRQQGINNLSLTNVAPPDVSAFQPALLSRGNKLTSWYTMLVVSLLSALEALYQFSAKSRMSPRRHLIFLLRSVITWQMRNILWYDTATTKFKGFFLNILIRHTDRSFYLFIYIYIYLNTPANRKTWSIMSIQFVNNMGSHSVCTQWMYQYCVLYLAWWWFNWTETYRRIFNIDYKYICYFIDWIHYCINLGPWNWVRKRFKIRNFCSRVFLYYAKEYHSGQVILFFNYALNGDNWNPLELGLWNLLLR